MTPCLICHGSGRHFDDMEGEWTNEPCRTCHGVGMVDLSGERDRTPKLEPDRKQKPRVDRGVAKRIHRFGTFVETTYRGSHHHWTTEEAEIALDPMLSNYGAWQALTAAGYRRTRRMVKAFRHKMEVQD